MKKLLFFALTLQSFALSAEEEVPMPGREPGSWNMLILIAIFALFFYLIMWRPEQKRRKALEEQRASLKKGDKVTAMGIIGTVVSLKEHTVILRMVEGAKIEFLKAAVSEVMPSTEAEQEEVKAE